jgi:uncharacterized protein
MKDFDIGQIPQQPGSFKQLIESVTPAIYARLKTAVELGKWENGEKLRQEQIERSLQIIIAYEDRHLDSEQRTGFLTRQVNKAQGGAAHNTLNSGHCTAKALAEKSKTNP